MRIFLKLFVVLLVAQITACATNPVRTADPQRLASVDQLRASGKVVGLGMAGININGPAARRKLAVQRALTQIAQQLGVRVSNVTVTRQRLNGKMTHVTLDSLTKQSVDRKKVEAVIYDEWWDGDKLYILMVAQ